MSNLLTFPKNTTNAAVTHIEATPDGIRLGNKLVGYSPVIRQLDAGQFDSSLANGLWVLAEIQLADRNNWFSPSDEQMAIIWRWLIACLFIHEQQDKNGTVDVTNEDGGTDRAVSVLIAAGITHNGTFTRQPVTGAITPDTFTVTGLSRVLPALITGDLIQQSTSNHAFECSPGRFKLITVIVATKAMKQPGYTGHIERRRTNLTRHPFQAIRFVVAQDFFFAAGHSHGWQIP